MDRKGNFYILIADDEVGEEEFDSNCALMENFVESEHRNWKFIYSNSVDETKSIIKDKNKFWKKLHEFHPSLTIDEKTILDIVLLDIEFPDSAKGFEVADEIEKEKLNLPFIFLTHHEEPDVIRQALNEKGYRYSSYCTKKEIFGDKKYEILVNKIEELFNKTGRFKNRYGILITHGTDTMAWGFAMLKYALKKLKTNIAMTGSQMPLEGFYSPSDAIGNLRTSLYILSRLYPSGIYVVFNNGKTVFSSHLQKVRKWDFDAFFGKIIGRAAWDGLKIYDDSIQSPSIHPEPYLERLYLIRTGGTIEAEKDPQTGALRATGDFVSAYLSTTLAKEFIRGDILNCYPSLKKDSSYLSEEHWKQVCDWVKEIENKEGNSECEVDWNFNGNVDSIICHPFLKRDSYEKLFNSEKKGIILLGYGAGNANVDPEPDKNNQSLITDALISAVENGKIIIVSSQVPLEIYDFDYEAGRRLLEIGAIPSGALSFPEAQVKLAYILGHEKQIEETAKKKGLTNYQLIKAAFLAGVEFRKEESKKEYEEITRKNGKPIRILDYDPFQDTNKTFEQGIEEVVEFQKG